jgi:hypothetical protein
MSNPYRPPRVVSQYKRSRRTPRVVQVISFVVVLVFGVVAGVVLGYYLHGTEGLAGERPVFVAYFGLFGLLFGAGGGYLTSRFVCGAIPFRYVIIGIGAFAAGLPFVRTPNYGGAATWLGVLSMLVLLVSIATGGLLRILLVSPKDNR